MPKVSKLQVEEAASAVYGRLISELGLQKALTCNLQIGRKLRAEKARRKKLDEADQKKAKKRRKKTNRKAIKSKTSDGNQKGSNELSQLAVDSSGGSGDGRRES